MADIPTFDQWADDFARCVPTTERYIDQMIESQPEGSRAPSRGQLRSHVTGPVFRVHPPGRILSAPEIAKLRIQRKRAEKSAEGDAGDPKLPRESEFLLDVLRYLVGKDGARGQNSLNNVCFAACEALATVKQPALAATLADAVGELGVPRRSGAQKDAIERLVRNLAARAEGHECLCNFPHLYGNPEEETTFNVTGSERRSLYEDTDRQFDVVFQGSCVACGHAWTVEATSNEWESFSYTWTPA